MREKAALPILFQKRGHFIMTSPEHGEGMRKLLKSGRNGKSHMACAGRFSKKTSAGKSNFSVKD